LTRCAAYLYPWDIDGDPAAADRIAGLGITEVSLAASYHDVRAVTPFHPEHRIVTRSAAVYYRPDPARWRGRRLHPAVGAPGGQGSFERAARRLRSAGLRVSAWLVITHNETLGGEHPGLTVRNAFGDPYPWALCAASPDVREYAATLAAEVVSADCVDGIDLEACGWYGFDHLSAHDKTGLGGGLFDLCFCGSCETACGAAGLDHGALREQVRAAIDTPAALPVAALPVAALDALRRVRADLAVAFLHAVIGSAKAACPDKPLLVHAHPDPWQAGANPGFAPGGPAAADGVILNCPADPTLAADLVARAATTFSLRQGRITRIAATLPSVTALGARAGELPARVASVIGAGATELRFYHAGLASAADLAAIRGVTRGEVTRDGPVLSHTHGRG
jgi:hypothetical protein